MLIYRAASVYSTSFLTCVDYFILMLKPYLLTVLFCMVLPAAYADDQPLPGDVAGTAPYMAPAKKTAAPPARALTPHKKNNAHKSLPSHGKAKQHPPKPVQRHAPSHSGKTKHKAIHQPKRAR